MPEPDFINFLKTLRPADWNVKVTNQWTVKDVVAHMIGWEKGDIEVIRNTWETKHKPWFLNTTDFDDFNNQAVEFYKNYTPEQLIQEWADWQKRVREEIDKIGYDNLRARPDLFGWLLNDYDKPDDDESHYKHHYKQIKNALNID